MLVIRKEIFISKQLFTVKPVLLLLNYENFDPYCDEDQWYNYTGHSAIQLCIFPALTCYIIRMGENVQYFLLRKSECLISLNSTLQNK